MGVFFYPPSSGIAPCFGTVATVFEHCCRFYPLSHQGWIQTCVVITQFCEIVHRIFFSDVCSWRIHASRIVDKMWNAADRRFVNIECLRPLLPGLPTPSITTEIGGGRFHGATFRSNRCVIRVEATRRKVWNGGCLQRSYRRELKMTNLLRLNLKECASWSHKLGRLIRSAFLNW